MTSNTARTVVRLAGIGLALVLTACGSDDANDKTSTADKSGNTGRTTQEPTPTATVEPLRISEHVLPADALVGYEAEGQAQDEDLRAFANAHDKPVAELRESGFVSGSSLFFTGQDRDFAISVAAEYADESAATAEAERLFASNTEGDPSIDVQTLEIPGIPGALGASLAGSEGAKHFTGLEIVFVDGAVVHEVFALGETERFDLDAVLASVTELYDRVAGHPVG